MKKIYALFMLCLVSSFAFAAVKVGDTFTASDGNTYKYKTVEIRSKEDYTITVEINKCVATGDVTLPGEVVDGENYRCIVVAAVGGDGGLFKTPGSVTSVSYPASIKTVNSYIYKGTPITTITFPATVESISASMSGEMTTAFDVAEDNPNYKTIDGVLFSKDGTTLVDYPAMKNPGGSYDIPAGTTKVTPAAFRFNQLVTINVPATVNDWNISRTYDNEYKLQNIIVDKGNTTYYDVDGVLCQKDGNVLMAYPRGRTATKYTIPSPVEFVSENAFYGVGSLKEIYIGNTVTKLAKNAFYQLNNLEYVKLGANTTDLTAGNPFVNCPNLAGVDVDAENPKYASQDGVLFTHDKKTLVYYPYKHGEDYTVPSGTEHIGDQAFYGIPLLKEITFPTSLVDIGYQSFQGCNYLSTITFEDSENSNFTTVGASAFFGTSSLKIVTFPASTQKINNFAFNNSGLKSFVFPAGVTKVERSAFNGCKNLVSVTMNQNLETMDLGVFANCSALTTVDFGGNTKLTTLSREMFINDTALETITIPAQITSIGAKDFQNCKALKHVIFEEGSQLAGIGESAFQDSGLEEISFPENLKTVGAHAFENCNLLERVNFPSTTNSISYDSFFHCTSLLEINVAKANQTYSSSDGILLTKDKEKLVTFPAGKANDRFTLLPPSIKTIGQYSFYYCDNLKYVTIPKKVSMIEARAFYFCKNLKHIAFLGEPAAVGGTEAFDDGTAAGYSNIKTRAAIYVREKEKSNFQAADYWKDFTNINTSFNDGTEEYLAMSDTYVNMLNSKSEVHSLVLPPTVTDTRIDKTYKVGLIGDYAFEENNAGKLKEVITYANVEYIGAKAFKQAENPSIENVIFVQKEPQAQLLSTYRFGLLPEDLPAATAEYDPTQYIEFYTADDAGKGGKKQNIYVRKSDETKCKNQWPKFAHMIDYKIKDAQVANKYGTFSREFDVDFSDCADQQIYAFTGKLSDIVSGGGDYGQSEYHIRMESINCGSEGDGTYVPQNTGILLKYMTGVATEGAYYTIGENDTNNSYQTDSKYSGTNVMKGVTVDAQTITVPTTSSIYVMQNGQFRYVNPTKTPNLNMPIHKAYLELTGVPAGAKVSFLFDDGDATTIDAINAADASSAPIYNIAGQRVNSRYNGVVIKNGKKYMMK